MRPAIQIEMLNQRYGAAGRFASMLGRNYRFDDRGSNGLAKSPPSVAEMTYHAPGSRQVIVQELESILTPFANLVANTVFKSGRSAELRELKRLLVLLGVEPDRDNQRDTIISRMEDYERENESK